MKRNLKRIELSPKHNSLDCKSRRGIRKERNWVLKRGWDLDRQKEVGRAFQVQGTARTKGFRGGRP